MFGPYGDTRSGRGSWTPDGYTSDPWVGLRNSMRTLGWDFSSVSRPLCRWLQSYTETGWYGSRSTEFETGPWCPGTR